MGLLVAQVFTTDATRGIFKSVSVSTSDEAAIVWGISTRLNVALIFFFSRKLCHWGYDLFFILFFMLSCWTAVENLDVSASEEGFSAERLGESKKRKEKKRREKKRKEKEKKKKKEKRKTERQKDRKKEKQRKKDRQKGRKTQRKKGGTQSKASTNRRLSTWLLWAIIRLLNHFIDQSNHSWVVWSSLFQRPWKQHSIKEPMTNKSVPLRLCGTTKMLHRPLTWFSWQRRKVRTESRRGAEGYPAHSGDHWCINM